MNPRPKPTALLGIGLGLALLGGGGYWLARPAPPAPPLAAAPPARRPAPAPPAADAASGTAPAPARPDTVAEARPAPAAADEAVPDSAAPCRPRPLAFAGSPAFSRPLQVHRYVGTVGGRAATAVLQWQTPDTITGSFHLLHDDDFLAMQRAEEFEWSWLDATENPSRLPPLPRLAEHSTDDLALTGEGLEATYSPWSLFVGPGGMSPSYTVLVPYRELRPLVRPGTPLARLLAARKIW